MRRLKNGAYIFCYLIFNSKTFCLDNNYLDLNHYIIMLITFAYFMDIPV